ncbi:uncharacterized protein LOC144134015 [Amblyomma americanum]
MATLHKRKPRRKTKSATSSDADRHEERSQPPHSEAAEDEGKKGAVEVDGHWNSRREDILPPADHAPPDGALPPAPLHDGPTASQPVSSSQQRDDGPVVLETTLSLMLFRPPHNARNPQGSPQLFPNCQGPIRLLPPKQRGGPASTWTPLEFATLSQAPSSSLPCC